MAQRIPDPRHARGAKPHPQQRARPAPGLCDDCHRYRLVTPTWVRRGLAQVQPLLLCATCRANAQATPGQRVLSHAERRALRPTR